jgi:hypothetical protein
VGMESPLNRSSWGFPLGISTGLMTPAA